MLVVGPALAAALFVAGLRRLPRLDLPAWLLVAYLLVSLPALVDCQSGHEALRQLHLELLALVLYLLVRLEPRRNDFGRRLPVWLAAAGLGVAAFRGLEEGIPGPLFQWGALPGSATLGNPDFVGEYGAALLPAGLLLLVTRKTRVLGLLSLALNLLLMSVSASLTAGLAGLAGLAFFLAVRDLPGRSPRGDAPPLSPAVVDPAEEVSPEPSSHRGRIARSSPWGRVCLVLAVTGILASCLAGLLLTEEGRGRLYLFRLAAECGCEAPVTGQGVGGFANAFMETQGRALRHEKEDRPRWTNARHAHNQLLQVWVERGGVALLVLCAALVAHLVALRRSRANRSRCRLIGGTLVALMVCFLGSVTFEQVPHRLLFFAGLGLAAQPLPRSRPGPPPTRRAVDAVVLLVALFLLILPAWQAVADVLFVTGRPSSSLALNPLDGRVRFFLGLDKLRTGRNEEACILLEDSLDSYPNLSTLMALGNCHARRGAMDQAEKWYLKAIDWKPDFSLAFANLAVVYHQQARKELAYRHAARARSLNPEHPEIENIWKRVCGDNPFCP